MNKPLSTFERKMKNPKFKKAFEEGYRELLFSELMISIMDDDDVSIRELAREAGISSSVIQDLRSGKQHDIKVSNLIKIANTFGYNLVLEKGEKRLTFQEGKKDHLSVVAVVHETGAGKYNVGLGEKVVRGFKTKRLSSSKSLKPKQSKHRSQHNNAHR